MKKDYLLVKLISLLLIASVISCTPDNGGDNGGDGKLPLGPEICYVLNNGNWGGNDATIQQYSTTTGVATGGDANNNIFVLENGTLLGDLAQSMLWIDDKLFVAVGGSQKLEILDENAKRLREPYLFTETGAQSRMMATDGDNVYLTNYDGNVYVYNASTADFIKKIAVGVRPEAISYVDGYLVVNNSGTLGAYDGTLSIISLDSGTTETIQLVNPYKASVVCNGKVYIIDQGNYDNIPSEIYCVSPKEATATPLGISASAIVAYDNILYYVNNEWSFEINDYVTSPLYALNVTTGEKSEFLPADKMQGVNSLSVNPDTGDIFIGYNREYGVLGYICIYDAQGVKRGEFNAGYYPGGVYFEN